MKPKILVSIIVFVLSNATYLIAQKNPEGDYNVSGYFFHPTAPRAIYMSKTITKVGANTYQVDYVGDLTGWGFRFTVDSSNHLTNWIAVGNTYASPASGFMTSDNPGSFVFPGPDYPGTSPWVQSTYNNTYDPATHTFYMHYGYTLSATDQNGYGRQVYEQYVLVPSPDIQSVTPLNGTSFTKVTIKGKNFSTVDPAAYSITFGNALVDSAIVLSDTKIIAWVGSGASGNVRVTAANNKSDTFPGFIYTPVSPVASEQWSYFGEAGFSKNPVRYVSAASGSNNVQYVAFVNAVTSKTQVMKYNGTKWRAVGADVSDGKSGFTNILLTKTNALMVGYVDSANGGNITVKKYSDGNWITLGSAGFAPAGAVPNPFSMAMDSTNRPYVLSISGSNPYSISVFKLQGNSWVNVGNQNFATSGYGEANLAIDKTTNTPYVIFDDVNALSPNFGYQATVMKFNGSEWVIVGNPGFTTGKNGIFYPDIRIDNTGTPLVSMQEDDGFERQSVYKYVAGAWTPVGYPRFSNGRSYSNCFAIDKKNNPFALFKDEDYNKQGTVMEFTKHPIKWEIVGERGFIPFANSFERNSLFFDTANTPMVAFSDINNGGKISVMKFNGSSTLTIAEQESSDNMSSEKNTGFSIFPNPAHSGITINFVATDASTVLQIMNIKGETVMQKQVASSKGNKNKIYLDISNLAAGNYVLMLKTNDALYTKQFIKD